MLATLKFYLTPNDGRYEDLQKGSWRLQIFRDFTAGLIVAMVAIPLAMGFAIASGLNPVHGIVGGCVAGIVGALFGGSKYQVYGPTAAFIPVIGGVMEKYGQDGAAYAAGYGFLILVSLVAAVILLAMGLLGLGRHVDRVPHSIVVGFTIGIAVTIMMSQMGEVLGLHARLGHGFFEKMKTIVAHLGEVNGYAVALGVGTFLAIKYLLRVSLYLPAPLIALGAATLLSSTVWAGQGLTLVREKYGAIPTDLLRFTPPSLPAWSGEVLVDIVYFSLAIVFVSAVESLLCSRMADRLADNQGVPFNPNKELWGQGMVNLIVPLLNGFPHTGALARTATNIKLGAVSPLAGVFKGVLKFGLAVYLATWLEVVPMACIGGVLLFVALNMVKPTEVQQVIAHGRFHVALMAYTAVAVILTDFLQGVLSAIVIYALLARTFEPRSQERPTEPSQPLSTPEAGEDKVSVQPVVQPTGVG